jgi:hypothetical protein
MSAYFSANNLQISIFLFYLHNRNIDSLLDTFLRNYGNYPYETMIHTMYFFPSMYTVRPEFNSVTVCTKILMLLNVFDIFFDGYDTAWYHVTGFVKWSTYEPFKDEPPGDSNARDVSRAILERYRFDGFYAMYRSDTSMFLTHVFIPPDAHFAERHQRDYAPSTFASMTYNQPDQFNDYEFETDSLSDSDEFEPDFLYDEPVTVPYVPGAPIPANVHVDSFVREAIEQFQYTRSDTCPICIEPFLNEPICMVFRCSHVFHCVCIQGSMDSGNGSCPVCRSRIKQILPIEVRNAFGSSKRVKTELEQVNSEIVYLKM